MRGEDREQDGVLRYMSAEQRVPKDHPLRAIRTLVDEVLRELSPRFSRIYSSQGRPFHPEKLLRALLVSTILGLSVPLSRGLEIS
jgi:transposase